MAKVPFEMIRADAKFNRVCGAAEKRAQRVADREREKLNRAEEKEIERHQKRMREISDRRYAIYKEVFSPVYDPLEEAAYAEAERRLGGVE